ncbi:unnamed protein product [Anisakis simplex]|uniref:PDZ domain-containing protein n=1 Tax=Anisakis simplex TaxID=6269 RepID=A0A0M3K4E5_ANISI|nr:unnamed protein product [Anisakis simplex]
MRSQIQIYTSNGRQSRFDVSKDRVNSDEDKEKIKENTDTAETRTASERPGRLGFSGNIPPKFITEITKEFVFKQNNRIGLSLSRSMIVTKIEECSVFADKLKLFDFIHSINEKPVEGKTAFGKLVRKAKRSNEMFKLNIRRLNWNLPTEVLPEGYDNVPGYAYFLALLVTIPGTDIGMSIRSFNSKVYVTNIEQQSMSSRSCLVGDCIVAVNQTPVTTVATCRNKMITSLTAKAYLVLTLERPVDKQAVRVVKFALTVEKAPHLNPRMAIDTTKIGLDEANKIKTSTVAVPTRSIYRSKIRKLGAPPTPREQIKNVLVSINAESQFTTIMADPYNPLLMEAVPPKRMDTFYAQVKSTPSSPSHSTSTTDSKQSLHSASSHKPPSQRHSASVPSKKSSRLMPPSHRSVR